MKQLWLFALVTVSLGCNEIEPGSCYPNPAGGAGGGDSLPIAGVGATTSGDYAEPPTEPLDDGRGAGGLLDTPDQPQDTGSSPPSGCNGGADPEFGKPADQYINCSARGLDASACSEVCLNAGASCVPLALHPYKSGLDSGKLTFCKNGWPTTTCTYTFANTDACTLIVVVGHGLKWFCKYAGE